MSVKAKLASSYAWRLGVFALLCLGMGSYFFYDGFVRYPEQRRVRQEFNRFLESHPREEWMAYAAERGLPPGTQGDPGQDHSDTDIFLQRALAASILSVGVYVAALYAGSFRRWIALDETGLSTSGGQRTPLDAITGLDKRRWRKKGIAVVGYGTADGPGWIKLDNWKYELEPTNAIVREIESRLRPEQVVGELAASAPTGETPAA